MYKPIFGNENLYDIGNIKNPECLYLMIKENPEKIHTFLRHSSYDALNHTIIARLINENILDEYEPDRSYTANIYQNVTHVDNFYNWIEKRMQESRDKKLPYDNLYKIYMYLKVNQGNRMKIINQKAKLEKFKSYINRYITDKNMRLWEKPFEEVIKEIAYNFSNEN